MEGSKIKNIVIVILVLLNLFLLVLSGGRRLAEVRSRDQARTEAIGIIRANGIGLDDDVVPRRIGHQTLQATRDMDREGELAAGLLGEDTVREHRGGEIYRYSGARGSVQFHSTGEVTAVFEPGAYPLGRSKAGDHAASVAALLGCKVLVTEENVSANGTGTVAMVQTVDGIRLADCVLTATYRKGELVEMRGLRMPDRAETLRDDKSIGISTAMMCLYNGLKQMGDIYSRIESISPVYASELKTAGVFRLIPMWAVHTDTGDYMLNTLTGQLSRMNGLSATAE